MSALASDASHERRYLTVQEVAELARCEHKTVRRAIRDARLRAFRPAGRLLIRVDDARDWIEGQQVIPAESGPAPRISGRPRTTVAARRGSVAELREIERRTTGV
jgi:excisionase family DNA binding protein